MRWLAIAIVTIWFFGAACGRHGPTPATPDASDGPPAAADVRGDEGGDEGGDGDGAGAMDAEPPACPVRTPEGQPCEPVDAGCGKFGCGELSCVCQEAGWHCRQLLCP